MKLQLSVNKETFWRVGKDQLAKREEVTKMRQERPEPGEDSDDVCPSTVGGASTAVEPAGGDAGEEDEEQAERANKQ